MTEDYRTWTTEKFRRLCQRYMESAKGAANEDTRRVLIEELDNILRQFKTWHPRAYQHWKWGLRDWERAFLRYEQASGDTWTIYAEEEDLVLELRSIYGIVTFKAKSLGTRIMVNDILVEFARLYIQGPVQPVETTKE